MQPMGECLNIFPEIENALACELKKLVHRHRAKSLLIASFQFDGEQRDPLCDVIVEFSRNPGTFFLVSLDQFAAHIGESVLGQLSISNVQTRSDVAGETAIGVESWHTRVEHPTVLSVPTPEPIFHRKRLALIECPS